MKKGDLDMDKVDLDGVNACIQSYFQALYTGDTALLVGPVFHPQAHLYCANMGAENPEGLTDWTMEDFSNVISGRESPEARGCARRERICFIDEAAPGTVMVKVEVLVGTREFVDYLTLLKLPQGWRIISKTCYLLRELAA